ncbi:MAG: phenylacetate--CoA ligase family protein, partial [Flavobacteriaceae bacterium]|nr:phenylacetate--CoA ligase family protein [Flavobacteriaceae bacterium]
SGKTSAGLTFYYITKSMINEIGNIKEFVIEQEELDTFRIKYSSNLELNERNKSLIKSKFTKFLEPGLTVHFDRVDALKRNESGKLKQFISHIN